MQHGFVKHIKGLVAQPVFAALCAARDGQEIEVDLEEVRLLGEQDADFRRSIVSSKETLDTIADASITELRRLREATGEPRLKIIASALNMEHCKQIVTAYRERGQAEPTTSTVEKTPRLTTRLLAKLDRHRARCHRPGAHAR